MKKVKLPFLFVLCLITFTGCNTNDNSFYYEEYLTIPNLTQIQTQSSYAVGDYLFVNSNINRLQSETGQNPQSPDLRFIHSPLTRLLATRFISRWTSMNVLLKSDTSYCCPIRFSFSQA